MTYYLLANPNSGAGKGARTLETLIPYLEKIIMNIDFLKLKLLAKKALWSDKY